MIYILIFVLRSKFEREKGDFITWSWDLLILVDPFVYSDKRFCVRSRKTNTDRNFNSVSLCAITLLMVYVIVSLFFFAKLNFGRFLIVRTRVIFCAMIIVACRLLFVNQWQINNHIIGLCVYTQMNTYHDSGHTQTHTRSLTFSFMDACWMHNQRRRRRLYGQ